MECLDANNFDTWTLGTSLRLKLPTFRVQLSFLFLDFYLEKDGTLIGIDKYISFKNEDTKNSRMISIETDEAVIALGKSDHEDEVL